MANLGLIDFKISLYIKVNGIKRKLVISQLQCPKGKTNFKFISQNIWPKWPSIGTKQARCQFGEEH